MHPPDDASGSGGPTEPATTEPVTGEPHGADAAEVEAITGLPHVRPPWAPLTLVAFVGLVACGYVAQGYYPRLVTSHPEVLLSLSARVRYLVLTAVSDMQWWSYGLIAGFRLALAYAVCHLIGRAFGRDVLVWFGRYLGVSAKQIQDLLQMFHKAEWVVIPFFVGSNIVAAITGISKVPARRLVPLVTVGIVGRLALWWWVAQIADDEVNAVVRFLDRYQWPAVIVTSVLTLLVIGFNLRRGRDFQLDS